MFSLVNETVPVWVEPIEDTFNNRKVFLPVFLTLYVPSAGLGFAPLNLQAKKSLPLKVWFISLGGVLPSIVVTSTKVLLAVCVHVPNFKLFVLKLTLPELVPLVSTVIVKTLALTFVIWYSPSPPSDWPPEVKSKFTNQKISTT